MSTMSCTIPGLSLKVFGRAIQSLSKIGDELYFEPLETGLYLRSVNPCRSAYACFQFSPNFFVHYVSGSSARGGAGEDDDALRCKVGMKSIMAVFRSLATIDKTVEKCRISLNMTDARLVFQMHCRHGIIKTHNLAFIECETLQAVYSKDMCPNKFTAPPKLLCEAVVNFQNTQEEITLIIRPDYVALKNYVEDEPDSSKIMHTELTLSPNEFENYQVGVDTDVTFCLRELRAVLSFCDLTGLPLTVQLEGPGRPITFSITSDPSFEANFLLATLAETDSSEASQHATQKSQASSTVGKKVVSKHTKVQNGAVSSKNNHHGMSTKQLPGSSRFMFDDGDDNELSSVMMDISMPQDSLPHPAHSQSQSAPTLAWSQSCGTPRLGRRPSTEQDNDPGGNVPPRNILIQNKYKTLTLNAHHSPENSQEAVSRIQSIEPGANSLQRHLTGTGGRILQNPKQLSLKSSNPQSDLEVSPIIPLQNSPKDDEEEEDDDDEIPGTPPIKKFRSVFFGTQSSTQPSQSQNKPQILAPDSDPE